MLEKDRMRLIEGIVTISEEKERLKELLESNKIYINELEEKNKNLMSQITTINEELQKYKNKNLDTLLEYLDKLKDLVRNEKDEDEIESQPEEVKNVEKCA